MVSMGFALDKAIFLLFMYQRGLSLAQALMCEAIYHIAAIVLEYPTGWISDKISRKASLLTGVTLVSVYYLGMVFAHEMWEFALLMAICAAGATCFSGSDTSLLYELLEKEKGKGHYLKFSARIGTFSQVLEGISIGLGAFIAIFSWNLVYVIMVVWGLGQFILLLSVHESRSDCVLSSDSGVEKHTARLSKSNWTSFSAPVIFLSFLAVIALIDPVAMSYMHSTQLIFSTVGVGLAVIGVYNSLSKFINAFAFIFGERLAVATGRKTALVITCVALMFSFILLPVALFISPMLLVVMSVPAIFFAEAFYVVAESLVQDYLVSSTRARVLSLFSMAQSASSALMYAGIGVILDIWGAKVTLVLLAVVMSVIVVAMLLGYRKYKAVK